MAYAIAVFAGKYDIPLKTGDVTFADSDTIADWAKAAVAKVAATGIIQGDEHKAFDPQGVTTRAQFAVVLKRMVMLMTIGDAPMNEDRQSGSTKQSYSNVVAAILKEDNDTEVDEEEDLA